MANLKATTFEGGLFEKLGTSTVSGTTVTVDLATGSFFTADLQSLSGNVATFTISNTPSTSGQTTTFLLKVSQGSTARQFLWSSLSAFKWQKYWQPGTGWVTSPTISTTDNTEDIYSFTTYDNGSTWFATIVGQQYQNLAIFGQRGVFAGGDYEESGNLGGNAAKPMRSNVMDYVTIGTPGNAADFGDLTVGRGYIAGASDGQRGVFGGGRDYSSTHPSPSHVLTDIIDYITISTTGNATDFGNLTVGRHALGSTGSGTRSVFKGGSSTFGSPTPVSNVMDYITIVTTGNATDFGDLATASRQKSNGSVSNGIRGLIASGFDSSGSPINNIEYITIATTGNGTDFGDLTAVRRAVGSTSDGSRGVFAGGSGPGTGNEIEYVAIATTGNSVDFGDLTRQHYLLTGTSNGTRGVFGGGWQDPVPGGTYSTSTIDYITIATTGNATDFGDLTTPRDTLGSTSGS